MKNGELTCFTWALSYVTGTTYQPLWKVEEIARPGDLISFNREDGSNNTNDGSQVVLYIGDGRVATICTENLSLSHNNNAPVREMALDVVAKGRHARIDNFREIGEIVLNLKPRSPEAMIQEAKRCWNREVPYEARFRNSEYYCTFWKYGFGFSKQVKSKNYLIVFNVSSFKFKGYNFCIDHV